MAKPATNSTPEPDVIVATATDVAALQVVPAPSPAHRSAIVAAVADRSARRLARERTRASAWQVSGIEAALERGAAE